MVLGTQGPWDPGTLGPLDLGTLGPWDSWTYSLLQHLLILTSSYLLLCLSPTLLLCYGLVMGGGGGWCSFVTFEIEIGDGPWTFILTLKSYRWVVGGGAFRL